MQAQGYGGLGERERGLIRAFLDTGKVEPAAYQRHRFAVRYTEQDIALLAELDSVHQRLSGPATRCILQRAYEQFGQARYARLAGISVAQLSSGSGIRVP